MGYDIHITRKRDGAGRINWTGQGEGISAGEWLALIERDPDLRVTTEFPINGPYHVVWRGADPPESEWLDWQNGDIFTKHPSNAMIEKMLVLAKELGAVVQGDDNEVFKSATEWSIPYDLTGKILVIDNYDSFTYNLVQYLGEMGADIEIRRNDAVTLEEIAACPPAQIILSPGPGTPDDAGITLAVIQEFGPTIPIFGVCLGLQAMGQALGGRVIRAPKLMHGKTSPVFHDGTGVFRGLPSPLEATRYHSLMVERETLPSSLRVTAETEDGEIMGLRHTSWPMEAVQFHPEAILTEHGKQMLRNFWEDEHLPTTP